MSEIKGITNESTKKEVSEYLFSKYKISDKAKNKIIEEDINGEVLFLLEETELKNLEIKSLQLIQIKKYIKENKEKYKDTKINEKITDSSNVEEIKSFMEKYFNFKEDLKGLDGKGFLALSEKEIESFRLNLGGRKKLIKFINYFKTINEKEKENESLYKITRASSKNEMSQYFKEKLKFSKESLTELEDLDGETLFSMEKEDINIFEIKEEEKQKLKELYIQIKNSGKQIQIDLKSNKEEILNFLKISLDFSENSLNIFKELNDFDAQYLFSLEDDDIDELEISNEEKLSLKEFLNKEKEKNKNLSSIINGNYNPEKSLNINYHELKNIQISPILKDSKYNIFFFIYIDDNYTNKLSFSTFVQKNKGFFGNQKYINYSPFILETKEFNYKINVYNQFKLKSILVQVPSNKFIGKLSIAFQDKESLKEYNTKIEINRGCKYFFSLSNLDIKDNAYNNNIFISQKINFIICDYFSYFFNKNKNEIIFQENFIKSLLSFINRSKETIVFTVDNLLQIFKYCSKFKLEIKKIDNCALGKVKSQTPLKKEFCLSNEEINQICGKNKNEKEKLLNLLVEIYANNDKDCLMNLIQSNNSKDYCKSLLNILVKRTLKVSEFSFQNKEFIPSLQKNLLSLSQNKDEINLIIKLSENLSKCIEFIEQNFTEIYTKLDKASGFFGKEKSYTLNLPDPKGNDDIGLIYEYLYKIFSGKQKEVKYRIINLEELFKELIDFYSTKSLENLCNLNNFTTIFNLIQIKSQYLEKLHEKIHLKIMNLINNNELSVDEIIKNINNRDIYYFDPKYINDENRNPSIFRHIPITNINENYKKNIQLIKENNLLEIFKGSNDKKRKEFYSILLEQIKKVLDFQSIFELFSLDKIEIIFIVLINKKIVQIKDTCADEKDENLKIIYKIFENIFRLNCNKDLDCYFGIEVVQINYEFASKFYFYLLEQKDLYEQVMEVNERIIDYFIEKTSNNTDNAESLISLLFLSPDPKFSEYLLNKMKYMIISEDDFYNIKENKNFRFFELFIEKHEEILVKNRFVSQAKGDYFIKSLKMKDKILNDLEENKIKYNQINKLIEIEDNIIIKGEDLELKIKENPFFKRILVISGKNEKKSIELYKTLRENFLICKKKFQTFEIIKEFYNTFYSLSKRQIINKIKKRLDELSEANINEIFNLDEHDFITEDFDLEDSIEQSKNIKYKGSFFFMSIYRAVNNNERNKSDNEIFMQSINSYKNTLTKIINQNETKEPFFEIEYINEIIIAIQNPENNFEKEIEFIQKEFKYLEKDNYIKNELINDLMNFSIRDKISMLLRGIIYFIEAFNKINKIEITDFMKNLKKIYETVISDKVTLEEIKEAAEFLQKYEYNVKKETHLIRFYELLYGKEDSILFLKEIKDSKLEIRNLGEFIDETENKQIDITDIDNLIDVYTFFLKLMDNQEIKTDEDFLQIFGKEFNQNKSIIRKLQEYLKVYYEIIQLFKSYYDNPEMTIQKVEKIIQDSKVEIFKEEMFDKFTFNIIYLNQNNIITKTELNELEDLRNKILLSSTNNNLLKRNENNENNENNEINRQKIIKDFVSVIDSTKNLIKTLNSLLNSGYPKEINIKLKIENSKVFIENDIENDLQHIIEYYQNINKNFKKSIRNGYENYPLLRLFYGKQFTQIYEKANKKDADISHLLNLVSLNKIIDTEIEFEYNDEIDNIENINIFLEKLFEKNNINLEEIYNRNKVLEECDLKPGLYRKIKGGDYSDLLNNILNIYFNLTGNAPIINTLLICNEDTNIEQIRSFLYRAIFCEYPALFLITNMECLDFSVTRNLILTLKKIYKIKNKKINSYLLFIYEKGESGLVRDLEKLIPEKNILNNSFLEKPTKINENFDKIEYYSSKFAGYGKTTEIKYKIKEKEGTYKYLPIGGSFTRNYVIKNLYNLDLDISKNNSTYLHIDLSDTDNNDLMNEILFKLIILKFINSEDQIFYLGYDIHLIIEIPKGFIDYEKKYKLLSLFKNNYIDKLNPLRLEEGAKKIKDSPISIVAEVLTLYDNNEIGKKNINLNDDISKTAEECDEIINRHFKVENQNYYQKMNFIKILSVQFRKFTENAFFNYDIAKDMLIEDIIEPSRKLVIKNFIKLTSIFTHSPFDSVLLSQRESLKIFNKYNEMNDLKEEIKSLANNKQEVFSFDNIKPSLVFFNRDGGSLSIISNNNKNDKEYIDLKTLWNCQNQNAEEELVDYKNLGQEEYLDQIKILFSLDKFGKEDLKKICEELGNYIFVSDNFIKMVRIMLNIEAKIPVILMGETGVGKTKLLEMLTRLYGKGICCMKKLQIHAGITDEQIVDFIERVTNEVIEENRQDELTWIFFDEINTCNSLGLITEIMCNHSYLGKKINDNFVFLGACNPYRVLTKEMKEGGLVYYNTKEKNELNNLVYTVNPLPHALLNFVFDFASLKHNDEEKYIVSSINSMISKIKLEGLITNIDDNETKEITNEIIQCISLCHDFIREKYDTSSVSLREIARFRIFFEYFIKYFKTRESFNKIHSCINIALYLCYYLRLNEKNYREQLCEKLNIFYKNSDFKIIPEKEISFITHQMNFEKEKGIALNRALRENLFTCFISIVNNIPLIIVGKPGTGKSLSFQILYNSMKGKNSEKKLFQKLGKLYRFYYQGSETSTSDGIKKVFEKAAQSIILKITKNSSKEEISNFLKKGLKFSDKSIKNMNLDGKEFLSLKDEKINEIELDNNEREVLKDFLNKEREKEKRKEQRENKIIEEVNENINIEEENDENNNILLESNDTLLNSLNEPSDKLETIENIPLVFFDEMGLAERSSNNPLKIIHYLLEKDVKDEVRFLGISNWRLDAAKINRALGLSITDYDVDDLKETAISIAEALNLNLSNKYKDFFETLAKTYYKYILYSQNNLKENKDFHGNRDFYNLIKIAMKELNERKDNINNENKVLTEVGNLSLDRNFGGLEESSTKIKEIFKSEFGHKFVEDLNYKFSVLDAIKKNILDPNSRYLMLISEDNDGSDIIKYLLDSMKRKYIELIGSKYKADIKSGLYSEEILNKIKYIMETDNALILRDLDMIYPSLYDLFNQNFTSMGDKKFARIAFEYAKISSEVNKDFHVIIIVNKFQIKNLKLDPPFLNRFEKHIINFELLLEKRDVEIAKKIFDYFSLISSFNNNTKLNIELEKMLINCKLHNIEGLIFKVKNDNINNEYFQGEHPDYEINLIKEVFKKIVPTFCQDIIASIISSNLNRKYNKFNEIVLNIYKNYHFNNFQSFFEKIKEKRNIIYTFSKITENLFNEDVNIENKFGIFNKKSSLIELIDSYKSENDLLFLLQTFINARDKNLLILSFSSNDLNKLCSINYIIENFKKDNPAINDKIIIFIVHMKRYIKGMSSKKVIKADLISFINDKYYQIFIDNLQGNENSDVFAIIQKKEEVLAKEYLESLNFIDNKIFTVLNYIDFKILNETKEINSKNYISEITKKIIEINSIKNLLNNNLKLFKIARKIY